MKFKMHVLLVALLASTMWLTACAEDTANTKENNDTEVSEAKAEEINTEEANPEVEEEKEVIPEVSQQIDTFPWDEDTDFLAAVKDNDTDVLISGFVTVSDSATDDELENISVAASKISGSVLEPGEVFSQNDTAAPYTIEAGYKAGEVYVGGDMVMGVGGGACNVSTTLYNASIAGNLEIVERHNHSMPVSYVPYGQDAAVYEGYKDFKFKNNTDHPMLLWAEAIDNRLYVGYYGKEAGPEVIWEHETLSETETATQYHINPELPDGEENILVEGMDGKEVNSILKIKHADGEEEIKDLGNSFYNPLTHVIEKNE